MKEEFCIHGDRTIVCIEMRSINERGGDKNTHTHTLFSPFLVCQKAQTFPRDGGVCSLPHWMRSVARWCTFTRTRPRSRSGLAKSSLTQLSTLKTLFKGTQTQMNTVFFFIIYFFSFRKGRREWPYCCPSSSSSTSNGTYMRACNFASLFSSLTVGPASPETCRSE